VAVWRFDSGALRETLYGASSSHAAGRRRSSGDFDFYSPGDLLSHSVTQRGDDAAISAAAGGARKRPVPPLLKRNTIADFANTRAYQESTASLISATDQGPCMATLSLSPTYSDVRSIDVKKTFK